MKKNGFTLIELLAVIVIIGIILLIAVPTMTNYLEDRKKSLFLTTAKGIIRQIEYENVDSSSFKTSNLSSLNLRELGDDNYDKENSFVYLYNDTLMLDLVGKGKYAGMYLCGVNSTSKIEVQTTACENLLITYKSCHYDGLFVEGTEYIDGQYKYKYKQKYNGTEWVSMSEDGWSAMLSDKSSTSPVTTALCTNIDNKPIVSMAYMFSGSQATSIDVSSFDTSNVTSMKAMFYNSKVTSLDLSNFDTSKVTDMNSTFRTTSLTSLTGLNNFNTKNVTTMHSMFYGSVLPTLDLSSFDTSSVTDMAYMFQNATTTKGYGRTHVDTDKFNASSNKPSTLVFTTALPTDYQLVEYIESTGTQYINTRVSGNNSNLSFEVKYSWTELPAAGKYGAIFGSYKNEASVATRILQYGSDKTYFSLNSKAGSSGSYTATRALNTIYVDTLSSSGSTITYNSNSNPASNTRTTGTDINNSIYAFAVTNGGSTYGSKRIYYLKIYDNGTLIRNFLPCYETDNNEIGFYDTVSKTFYGNVGTGTFNKGNNI